MAKYKVRNLHVYAQQVPRLHEISRRDATSYWGAVARTILRSWALLTFVAFAPTSFLPRVRGRMKEGEASKWRSRTNRDRVLHNLDGESSLADVCN